MKTILDSNVLFDMVLRDSTWYEWSIQNFKHSRSEGQIVVNAIIFAEVGGHFLSFEETMDVVKKIGIELEDLPWRAAHSAGRAHRVYRKVGGTRERLLPDFLIGAHAEANGYRILTRDASRYRTYFPHVELITPDTHP